MKKVRLFMPVVALLFAFAGAFASVSAPVITGYFRPNVENPPCNSGDMDNGCTLSSGGTRCLISGQPAWQQSDCTVEARKN